MKSKKIGSVGGGPGDLHTACVFFFNEILCQKVRITKKWIKGSLVNLIFEAKLSKQHVLIMITWVSEKPESLLSKLAAFPYIHRVKNHGCTLVFSDIEYNM